MSALSIIHDCDPGLDDAVALLLALASPEEINLLGVTTVAGNIPLADCNNNARKVCELAGRPDVAIYPGCPRPMLNRLVTATHVHGESGIGRAELPPPTMPLRQRHAVDYIIATLKARDDVILCPTGPLTNIALAFIQAPEIVPRVRQIVLMGGAINGGNVSPVAEFNFFVDPHAAAVVFRAGAPTVMIGLDLTHQALVTPARLQAIRELSSPVAQAVVEMLASLPDDEHGRYGGNPLHDPCVIAYLLRPDLFGGKDCLVEIVTDSGPAQGQSVVDRWGVTQRDANAKVLTDIDADGFFALLTERLGRYGG